MKFYVFSNRRIIRALELKEAIELFKKNNNNHVRLGIDYISIGIEDSCGSCDLLVKKGGKIYISNDIESSFFKEFKKITVNTISILKREFSLE